MGRYVNDKWEPTWGDDQFGVVDSLPQMYNKVRDLEAENHKLRDELEKLRKQQAHST